MPDISELNGTAVLNVREFDGLTVTEVPTPFAAYSVRLLNTLLGISYTGDCIRVREDGGDTETDIGFSSGNLDETALAAHCGSNNGYVRTWYSQVGTADAQQATKTSQLKIYDGATGTTTLNSRPILEATENVTSFTDTSISQAAPYTAMSVSYNQNDFNRAALYANSGDVIKFIAAKNKTQTQTSSTSSITASAAHNDAVIIGTFIVNGSSSFTRGLSINASAETTGTLTDVDITDIQPAASGTGASSMQELILWDGALDATTYGAIETDMDTYFNVT